MVSRVRGAASAAALLVSLTSCASAPTSDTAQNAAAISGGAADSTHTGVVGIVLETSQGIATCSGELIAPNLVLTARHCVSQLTSEGLVCQTFTDSTGTHQATTAAAPYPARNFAVTPDQFIQNSSQFYDVAQVMVPPSTTNVPMCGKDIALLRLTTAIPGGTLMTPRLDLPPHTGEMFTAVGYGATDGNGNGAGERRVRDGLTVQFVGQYLDHGIEVLAEAELLADTGVCSGDSGGPALDQVGQIFGTLSRGAANTCDSPIYTRVDQWADWIRAQTRTAVGAIGATPPAWIDPPPANSANQGEPCRSDAQCVSPLFCAEIGSTRVCTQPDCNQCPQGWTCGLTDLGSACVPDPNAPADAGTTTTDDSGTGTTPDDSGTVNSADGGTGSMGGMHGGCTAAPSHSSRDGAFAFGALALAFAASRRRRRH